MSRYFPHTSHEEDQPLAKTILTTHVLTRAVTTGTIIGGAITTTRHLIPSLRQPGTASLATRLLISASTGTVVGIGLSAVAMVARMYGRQHIEWQDRSWRLLESQGQVETDDWTYAGMGAGAVAALAGRGLGWRAVVGGAGLGSVGGMVGYMGWRYGVKGGKFPEREVV